MGTDDLFKKRREDRKQRQHETKTPKANSYLIVTEGERTEPYYFSGLKNLIVEKIGGTVNVVELPSIDIQGKGSSTGKLIEITEQLIKEAKVMYQNVWIVFDKDDFEDFDQAIQKGVEKDIVSRGAISRLNIGYIFIFIIAILRYIGMNGMRSWMQFLKSME